MLEKMQQLDAEIQSKQKESAQKVEAFAQDILSQCQHKGFTLKEVEALTEVIKTRLSLVKYIHEHKTPFQIEQEQQLSGENQELRDVFDAFMRQYSSDFAEEVQRILHDNHARHKRLQTTLYS